MSEKRPDDLIGSNVGPFTIQEEIGRGGMATVYSAMQHSMKRKVAIKVLPRHFMHDPDFIERFEREVEVISHLEHPHILPIYDYGEADGVPFIAMRYLGGGSMAQMVRRGVPELKALVKPLQQVCEALDYAHQQGIIHRDLKPGNIMLGEHGNAYLSDFGIARVMGSNLTGSAIIGTPAYMSPEQAHGVNIDARSDIYSLGIVLFELITGREPYQAETPMSLLMMQINEPIPPIRDFREGVPEIVQDVVNTATAKNPDDRYASATELAEAFAEALKGHRTPTTLMGATKPHDKDRTITDNITPLPKGGGTVIADSNTMRPSGALESPMPTQKFDSESTQPQRGLPIPAIATVVLLLVVAIGAGLFFLTDIFDPPAETVSLPVGFRFVETDNYSIGIPNAMLPDVDDFINASNEDRILHVWQTDNTYVTVALVNADRVTWTEYFDRYYSSNVDDGQGNWQLVSEATAEDGTVRESYRITQDAAFDNGQMDIFYQIQDGFLVVVEMYTSDAVAANPDLINDLQTILNSLQVNSDT